MGGLEAQVNNNSELTRPRENCGVFGVWAPSENVSQITASALLALQHRGQESTGIVVSNGYKMSGAFGMGEISQVFRERTTWETFNGKVVGERRSLNPLPFLSKASIGIGHNRYSTTGESKIYNAGPILISEFALSHNGNLTNAEDLKEIVLSSGRKLRGSTDSEALAHFIALQDGSSWEKKIIKGIEQTKGSFSLTMMTKHALYAARDTMGNRPLAIGKLNNKTWVVASETSAIENIGGKVVRDVNPGEIIKIDKNGLQTINQKEQNLAYCGFEPTYLMRPDSLWQKKEVASLRLNAGQLLARHYPVKEADIVSAIPYSAVLAAQGFADEANIPFIESLFKHRWVGRTFMRPNHSDRVSDVNKYSVFAKLLRSFGVQSLVLVDDSIVRGTTTKAVIKSLRQQVEGLKVHLRIVWPKIEHPCPLGVDFPTYQELFHYNHRDLERAAEALGADSLAYLAPEQLALAYNTRQEHICFACSTGNYPLDIKPETLSKHILETNL